MDLSLEFCETVRKARFWKVINPSAGQQFGGYNTPASHAAGDCFESRDTSRYGLPTRVSQLPAAPSFSSVLEDKAHDANQPSATEVFVDRESNATSGRAGAFRLGVFRTLELIEGQ